MKFKDHRCFSFNGKGRILQAAISRNGASHDSCVARAFSNFRERKLFVHRVPNREMYDTVSQLPYGLSPTKLFGICRPGDCDMQYQQIADEGCRGDAGCRMISEHTHLLQSSSQRLD
jgi:hypothetical protein